MRAAAVTVLVALTVAADVVGLLLDLQGVALMDAADAGTLSNADAVAFDSTYGSVGLLQAGIYLLSAIAVLAWLSRAVENVPPLTGQTPQRSPRGAIGWWFVPFANFVIPYQIVADTLRRLRTYDARPERLVLPWWGIWLAGNFLSTATLRLPQTTIDELRLVFAITALGELASAVAGVLLILIVRAVEQRSATRAATLGLDRLPQPAWPAFVTARHDAGSADPASGTAPDPTPEGRE
jgi:hypothetical protein